MVVEAHEGLHITIKSPRGRFQAFEKTSTRRRRGEEKPDNDDSFSGNPFDLGLVQGKVARVTGTSFA